MVCPYICIPFALRSAMQLHQDDVSIVEVDRIRFSGPCTHILSERAYHKKEASVPMQQVISKS
jgi:hypothetical protein